MWNKPKGTINSKKKISIQECMKGNAWQCNKEKSAGTGKFTNINLQNQQQRVKHFLPFEHRAKRNRGILFGTTSLMGVRCKDETEPTNTKCGIIYACARCTRWYSVVVHCSFPFLPRSLSLSCVFLTVKNPHEKPAHGIFCT